LYPPAPDAADRQSLKGAFQHLPNIRTVEQFYQTYPVLDDEHGEKPGHTALGDDSRALIADFVMRKI